MEKTLNKICLVVLMAAVLSCNNDDEAPPFPSGFGDLQEFTTYRKVDIGWESSDDKVMCGTLYLPKNEGRYPAVMWHWGSNAWSRSDDNIQFINRWLEAGIAVLSYDKRGVRLSQGDCCPWQSLDYFPLLGQDVLSGVRAIADHPEVVATAIGVYGFSQGGWVVPVAVAEAKGDIAFFVIGSGPTVTLEEELTYSVLTGENNCSPTDRPQEEIAQILKAEGPSRFDPKPFLETINVPGLWVYGSNDLSVPVAQSTQILDELITNGRPFEYWIIPDANHSWIVNGSICQQVGEDFADRYDDIFNWINALGD